MHFFNILIKKMNNQVLEGPILKDIYHTPQVLQLYPPRMSMTTIIKTTAYPSRCHTVNVNVEGVMSDEATLLQLLHQIHQVMTHLTQESGSYSKNNHTYLSPIVRAPFIDLIQALKTGCGNETTRDEIFKRILESRVRGYVPMKERKAIPLTSAYINDLVHTMVDTVSEWKSEIDQCRFFIFEFDDEEECDLRVSWSQAHQVATDFFSQFLSRYGQRGAPVRGFSRPELANKLFSYFRDGPSMVREPAKMLTYWYQVEVASQHQLISRSSQIEHENSFFRLGNPNA